MNRRSVAEWLGAVRKSRSDRELHLTVYEHTEAALGPAARSSIGDDGLGDRQRRRLDSERTQEVLEELPELDRHELALANRLLPSQPQHPVPEVPVDSLEGLRPQPPGQLLRVRLVRKDQVDLHGAGKEQHPAVLLGEAVPLLEQRLERREQLRQR